MTHEIFISYAEEDKNLVSQLTEILELQSINCWYRNRNLGAGGSDQIEDALKHSKILIILVSNHVSISIQVINETKIALDNHIGILLIKIENVSIVDVLTKIDYIDAFPDDLSKYEGEILYRIERMLMDTNLETIGNTAISTSIDIPNTNLEFITNTNITKMKPKIQVLQEEFENNKMVPANTLPERLNQINNYIQKTLENNFLIQEETITENIEGFLKIKSFWENIIKYYLKNDINDERTMKKAFILLDGLQKWDTSGNAVLFKFSQSIQALIQDEKYIRSILPHKILLEADNELHPLSTYEKENIENV